MDLVVMMIVVMELVVRKMDLMEMMWMMTDKDAGKDPSLKEDRAEPVRNREEKVVICLQL